MEAEIITPHPTSNDDFCSAVLSKFSSSTATNEHHNHVCAAVGATSQELKDQNLPLTPVSYFGATCASLDKLSASHDPPGHIVDALITLLSLAFDAIPVAVLKKKHDYLSELLIRVLRVKSVGENGVNPGLKCVARLVVVKEKIEWANVAQLYGIVVGYMTDDRVKLRKQSHSCLREILEYFQSMPVLAPLLAPASESITNVFERFLLLAGGSNVNMPEGPKGAQEVLYILDALKLCIPYMSLKPLTNIMKYFKSLLELKHPLVTRRIADGLNSLCLHSTGEVSAEALLDLLCSLATSLSTYESAADSMTFTARLLDTGMRKVYFLNRQLCVVKLPVVFSALKDVLTSGHEEALVVAVETFKSLINSCIDESLIRQGVDQVTIGTTRRSGPTVMEKVCATIESLLDHHYGEVWDMSFQIVSTMFDKLGKFSFYFLKQTIETLAEIQKLPDEDFAFRKELHECMGTALGAMGSEKFLSLLPFNLEVQNLSDANLWLFPILKQFIVGDHLEFFTDSILPIIREMKQKSFMLEQGGKIHSARSVDGIVYSLWSLLPSFCNYPVDTAESFKGLQEVLCTAFNEEPDVRGILCSSLQILVQQNKRVVEGEENGPSTEVSIPEKRATALYTSEVANTNLMVLKSSAHELLSVLTRVYFQSSKDTAGILQSTIGEIASISDKEVVARFFKKSMQKLLKITQDAGRLGNSINANNMQVDNPSNEGSLSMARAQLFDLAVSFLPGLGYKEIDLLFVAISPSLKDSDGMIQKRAYRVLSLIFQHSDGFISKKLDFLLNLMIEVLPACHFSSKRYRLDCLYFLIIHVSKNGTEQMRREVIASFLTEIVLSLKETNKKTRNRAYDILVQIGHVCGDEDKGGEKEKLLQLFNMVAGGLAGQSSHMISASMTGLARLAYEFYDLVSAAYNVLPSTFLLLQRKNKEVIRANLGLLKVLVAKSPAESLKNHLQSIIEGLLNWQDSTRNHFKAKVKLLVEMLVKKCGLEAVKQVMPEEHMKLLTNIRKLKERNERKQYAKSEENRSILSKATTSRLSRWNHTKIFSDVEDEDTRMSAGEYENAKSIHSHRSKHSAELPSKALFLRSKKSRRAAKSLQEDLFDKMGDEPLDLLDSQKMRSSLRSSEVMKKKVDSDDELEIFEGRLLIREDDGKKRTVDRKHNKRDMPLDSDDERSELKSNLSTGSKRNQKRRKTSESGWAYTGKEYASKKASGDVKRKDKLEPYAYWPLDRKMVSKRAEHRAAARKGMASVVKLTKKLEGKSVSNALSVKGLAMKKGKKKVSVQRR